MTAEEQQGDCSPQSFYLRDACIGKYTHNSANRIAKEITLQLVKDVRGAQRSFPIINRILASISLLSPLLEVVKQ